MRLLIASYRPGKTIGKSTGLTAYFFYRRSKGHIMSFKETVLVTGAGGFIGHHLTKYLVERGYWVRGVDLVPPSYETSPAHSFEILDLRRFDSCLQATRGVNHVYALAADMGGIGFIESNKGLIR